MLRVIDVSDVSDSDSVVGDVKPLDRRAGAYFSRLDDPQVGAGSVCYGETAREAGVAHAYAQLEAGDPRLGHLKDGGSCTPAFADHCLGEVQTGGG
jgi:hypothetical protein